MFGLGSRATLAAWYAREFSSSCGATEAFYARAGAWSPDGQQLYFGTTGGQPNHGGICFFPY